MDHILTIRTLIKQEIVARQCFYYCFVDFKKIIDTIPHDKLCKLLQQLGVPPHLQQAIKTMYTTVYAKVQINGDTHREVLSDIGVKQGCSLSSTLFGLYIDQLETYLDEINKDFPCLFNTVVAIPLMMMMLFYFLNQENSYKDF